MLESLPNSENSPRLRFDVVNVDHIRELRIFGQRREDFSDFQGSLRENGEELLLACELTSSNAQGVRKHLPWLNPKPLGLNLSAGVGDRLGLATSGHARAFRKYGKEVLPVFAQQSIREMVRLERTPQAVMDDATFGLVEASWVDAVGSDADHLKTSEDIDACLSAGFTLFTLDPGAYVFQVPEDFDGKLSHLPWSALEDSETAMIARYEGISFDVAGKSISMDSDEIRRAAFKYGAAVAYTVSQYRHLMQRASYPVEVEVAIDETDDVTTFGEHIFMATEMKRLGMSWVSFAPRYVDGFEKGLEFKGDIDLLASNLEGHASIAKLFGPYKLSLHSGSDKFGIYSMAHDVTGGLLHLKTSGTSYLEALGVSAVYAPALFREIYDVSRTAYEQARSSYQVSADFNKAPRSQDLSDDDLGELLMRSDTRQILHVGYGAALSIEGSVGEFRLRNALKLCLIENKPYYDQAMELHIGRHLALLGSSS